MFSIKGLRPLKRRCLLLLLHQGSALVEAPIFARSENIVMPRCVLYLSIIHAVATELRAKRRTKERKTSKYSASQRRQNAGFTLCTAPCGRFCTASSLSMFVLLYIDILLYICIYYYQYIAINRIYYIGKYICIQNKQDKKTLKCPIYHKQHYRLFSRNYL